MNLGPEGKATGNTYLLTIILLVLITLTAYSPIINAGFVNIDDAGYVYENEMVRGGLKAENLHRALTGYSMANWHPLTMLSLMLDVELFGVNPLGHHLVNLFWHLSGTLILFLILYRATSRVWAAALAAALFAIHPLHVESVAWISERKDVLSTFFGLAAIGAWFRYVRRPSVGQYGVVLLLMTVSLTAKAMFVTLPGLLMAMDVWPLRRLDLAAHDRWRTGIALAVEKLPLMAPALAISFMTLIAQSTTGAVRDMTLYPLADRLMNALRTVFLYLYKAVWPVDLAIFYPFPSRPPVWEAVVAGAVLILITILAVRLRSRRYLLSGWLWYLIALVPVIGLVQVGNQSMADRYTYVPLIGIFIMVAYSLDDLVQAGAFGWKPATAAAVAAILVLTGLCYRQVSYWENTEILARRSLTVTRDNTMAQNSLVLHLISEKRYEEAEQLLLEYARRYPRDVTTRALLGQLYMEYGKLETAEKYWRELLELQPDNKNGTFWLGATLLNLGRLKEAEAAFRRSLEIGGTARDHNFLGVALARQKRLIEARRQFLAALQLNPADSQAQTNLNKLDRLIAPPKVSP